MFLSFLIDDSIEDAYKLLAGWGDNISNHFWQSADILCVRMAEKNMKIFMLSTDNRRSQQTREERHISESN